MLRDHEKKAVFSLLIKQVEAQEARTEAERQIEAARQAIAEATRVTGGIRSALTLFGFDMAGEKPWDPIRDAIGQAEYNRAIRIGKGEESELPEAQGTMNLGQEQSDQEQSSQDDEEGETDLTLLMPSNIREMVTERVRMAGNQGVKASQVKDYIAGQGIEMHEKTVGMTLYRLSKEGITRREGRTWFFVPEAERNEAADGTSGQDTSTAPSSQPATPLARGGQADPSKPGQEVEHDNMTTSH